MTRLTRRLIALLTIPLVLVLTSCMRLTTDYEIVNADEIHLTADIGMQNSFADQMGSEMPDLCAQDDSLGDVDNAKLEPYTEEGPDGYTGCRISGTGRLADMSGGGTAITFADDVWTFHMEGDEAGEEMSAEMFTDFRVSVTFPGEVLSHNGTSTVDGNTVTWTDPNDMFTAEGLKATGSDEGGGAGDLLWLWITLGVLALAAIAAAVYFMTRKKKAPVGPQGYPGGHYNQGYPSAPGPQGYQPAPGYQQSPGPQGYRPAPGPQGYPSAPDPRGGGQGQPGPNAPFRPDGPPPTS